MHNRQTDSEQIQSQKFEDESISPNSNQQEIPNPALRIHNQNISAKLTPIPSLVEDENSETHLQSDNNEKVAEASQSTSANSNNNANLESANKEEAEPTLSTESKTEATLLDSAAQTPQILNNAFALMEGVENNSKEAKTTVDNEGAFYLPSESGSANAFLSPFASSQRTRQKSFHRHNKTIIAHPTPSQHTSSDEIKGHRRIKSANYSPNLATPSKWQTDTLNFSVLINEVLAWGIGEWFAQRTIQSQHTYNHNYFAVNLNQEDGKSSEIKTTSNNELLLKQAFDTKNSDNVLGQHFSSEVKTNGIEHCRLLYENFTTFRQTILNILEYKADKTTHNLIQAFDRISTYDPYELISEILKIIDSDTKTDLEKAHEKTSYQIYAAIWVSCITQLQKYKLLIKGPLTADINDTISAFETTKKALLELFASGIISSDSKSTTKPDEKKNSEELSLALHHLDGLEIELTKSKKEALKSFLIEDPLDKEKIIDLVFTLADLKAKKNQRTSQLNDLLNSNIQMQRMLERLNDGIEYLGNFLGEFHEATDNSFGAVLVYKLSKSISKVLNWNCLEELQSNATVTQCFTLHNNFYQFFKTYFQEDFTSSFNPLSINQTLLTIQNSLIKACNYLMENEDIIVTFLASHAGMGANHKTPFAMRFILTTKLEEIIGCKLVTPKYDTDIYYKFLLAICLSCWEELQKIANTKLEELNLNSNEISEPQKNGIIDNLLKNKAQLLISELHNKIDYIINLHRFYQPEIISTKRTKYNWLLSINIFAALSILSGIGYYAASPSSYIATLFFQIFSSLSLGLLGICAIVYMCYQFYYTIQEDCSKNNFSNLTYIQASLSSLMPLTIAFSSIVLISSETAAPQLALSSIFLNPIIIFILITAATLISSILFIKALRNAIEFGSADNWLETNKFASILMLGIGLSIAILCLSNPIGFLEGIIICAVAVSYGISSWAWMKRAANRFVFDGVPDNLNDTSPITDPISLQPQPNPISSNTDDIILASPTTHNRDTSDSQVFNSIAARTASPDQSAKSPLRLAGSFSSNNIRTSNVSMGMPSTPTSCYRSSKSSILFTTTETASTSSANTETLGVLYSPSP